jgi:23S rRNA A1618 N6-methylase RlmF
LTYAILAVDYQLKLEIPLTTLTPMIPNRIMYLQFIHQHCIRASDKQIHAIDIGTGASCIYPLLGCRLYHWSFIATEIDPTSVEYALANVHRNHYSEKIKVLHSSSIERLPISYIRSHDSPSIYHFSMCNPRNFYQISLLKLFMNHLKIY